MSSKLQQGWDSKFLDSDAGKECIRGFEGSLPLILWLIVARRLVEKKDIPWEDEWAEKFSTKDVSEW